MKKRGPVTYTALQQGEEMKTIKGFPEYYITNFGRVLTTRPLGRGNRPNQGDLREIQLSFGTGRYYYANIYNENNYRTSLRLNRLVYQHFNKYGEPLYEGFVVDHIDNNKLNNHIDNLRQVTQKENLRYYHNTQKQNKNA